MNSILWHDYETTGTSPALDRPLQFAGVRTDENLTVISDPFTFYCKPSRDVLPSPEACLVTGITPQYAEEVGLPEPEFIAKIHDEFMVPATCGAGYNSLRFDDEFTRYTLYRNFFDPYEREWQGGNSRWDIIDMLRLTYALRPEGIEWPIDEEGYPSFRLELLTSVNGITHEDAHDALSDVFATISMAKLVKDKQPKLYQFVYEHRRKQQVTALIDIRQRKPFLHVSSKLPRSTAYTALMVPLCPHPTNQNAVICFNLSQDPTSLLALSAGEIKERLFTPAAELPEDRERVALKAVHLNRCPIVSTPKLLNSKAAERIGIDIDACEKHWLQLKDADLLAKLTEIFSGDMFPASSDPESALYDGFLANADRPLLARVRKAAPEELSVIQSSFSDKRYQELLFRYRARYFPEVLSEEELHTWEEHRFRVLSEPSPGRLHLDAYFQRLDELEHEPGQNPEALGILNKLRDWGDEILTF